ncbi:MAG TPA: ABC transporter substrate-binding protein [Reyranella sp.]|nr:ABC transporter substrate-binding protein [Reyranella sp.]
MRRRHLLVSALALPAQARAQQAKVPTIGWLHPGSPEGSSERIAGFIKGLGAQGLVDGRNVAIDYRWARGDYDRLPALATELANRPVDVIVSGPINSTVAAKAATTTIPIVFTIGTDPMAFGLVASLNRPGGNLTGVAEQISELLPKRLQLLHELLPTAKRVGVLFNAKNPNGRTNLPTLQAAAVSLGVNLTMISAAGESEVAQALEAAAATIDALFIDGDPNFSAMTGKLANLTARLRLPAVYYDRSFAVAGCLMSYGPSVGAMYGRAANYVARILKGAKPDELPVVQPEQFQLVVNLKTARALGIAVPQSILGRADEVIE